jgi:hypothetical protein
LPQGEYEDDTILSVPMLTTEGRTFSTAFTTSSFRSCAKIANAKIARKKESNLVANLFMEILRVNIH